MHFENPPMDDIYTLIRETATIAVVGLSPRPERPSQHRAQRLRQQKSPMAVS